MLHKKIITAIATFTTIGMFTFAPFAFADTVVLSGNGALSNVNATDNNTNTVTNVQNNSAQVANTVTASSNTGNNDQSFNTGGANTTVTGNAGNVVDIANALNKNVASIGNNGAVTGGTGILISGNGAFGTANAAANNTNTTEGFQYNTANVANTVDANANTGWNTQADNTGGTNSVFTGSALNKTLVSTQANLNEAVFGGSATGATGGTGIVLDGNGAESISNAAVNNSNTVIGTQTNGATVANDVTGNANSGWNDQSFSTGGDVFTQTGPSANWTGIDNQVNANFAALGGGVSGGNSLVKVLGDGAFSQGAAALNNTNTLEDFGTNIASLGNSVGGQANSGNNSSAYGTAGFVGIDPVTTLTGSSTSTTQVMNSANLNEVSAGNVIATPFGMIDIGFSLPSVMGL